MEDLNFNIPRTDNDRIEILNLVKISINKNIQIVGISHKPYLEIYTFTDGTNYANIKIYFNGKHIITKVDNQTDSGISDFGNEVKAQLTHIEKKCILSRNSSLSIENLNSISEELLQFVKNMINGGEKKDIKVLLTSLHDYDFILTFFDTCDNRVQYKFIFNSKKVITQIQAINRDQSQIFNVIDELINRIKNSENEESENLNSSNDDDDETVELVDIFDCKIEKI